MRRPHQRQHRQNNSVERCSSLGVVASACGGRKHSLQVMSTSLMAVQAPTLEPSARALVGRVHCNLPCLQVQSSRSVTTRLGTRRTLNAHKHRRSLAISAAALPEKMQAIRLSPIYQALTCKTTLSHVFYRVTGCVI